MGFFSNYKAIGRINALIKQLEPHLDYVAGEIRYPYSANRQRLRDECGIISILMAEIMRVASESGRSVLLAPYYLVGSKMSLMDINGMVMSLLNEAKLIF